MKYLICSVVFLLLNASTAVGVYRQTTPIEHLLTELEISFVDRAAVTDGLYPVPHKNRNRAERLRELFRSTGCQGESLYDQRDGSDSPNIICTLKGESDETIIVGAHIDRPRYGDGIVNNWSGAAMLPSLYRALKGRSRRHTYLFIGFSKTGRPNTGSAYFVHELAKSGELERVRAMVNLKALGLEEPAIWTRRSDPDMVLDLSSVGEALSQVIRDVNFRRDDTSVGSPFAFRSDAESFRRLGIPVITLHSLSAETARLIRATTHDSDLGIIDKEHYHATYRLLAYYLAYLDRSIEIRRAYLASSPRERADLENAGRERRRGFDLDKELRSAVRDSRDLEKVRQLLESGADPNAYDNKGNTSLVLAITQVSSPPADPGDTLHLVRILIGSGADSNLPTRELSPRTPLAAAAEAGHEDIVTVLLDAGANLRTPPNGISPDRAARVGGNQQIIELFEALQ